MKTKKRKPKYLIIILIIIATLMVIACAIGLYAYTYVKSSYNGEARWVYIPENCNKEAFRDSLNNKFGEEIADKSTPSTTTSMEILQKATEHTG